MRAFNGVIINMVNANCHAFVTLHHKSLNVHTNILNHYDMVLLSRPQHSEQALLHADRSPRFYPP
jgi:hypothetical protein